MTRGALRAHERGIVTAVSVVANGRAFDDAVEVLRERPALDVGAHLTLVGERPLSPAAEVPSLLGGDGALLSGWPAFLRRYLRGGVRGEEIERELRRQLERLLASGLAVVHLNSHQHLHTLPGIFAIVVRLAREHGVPFVRVPAATTAFGGLTRRGIQVGALAWLARRSARHLESARGVGTVGETLGILEAGRLSTQKLLRLLPAIGASAELVCHPGLDDPALAASYRWGYRWERETAALCDPAVPEALRAAGVELTSFRRLAAG